jgi:hypothetical protein
VLPPSLAPVSLGHTQVQSFGRVALDNDKKVREALYVAFAPLASAVKKQLATHLKTLFPSWYLHQYDGFREVGRAARIVFEHTFPEAKRRDVLLFCKADFLAAVESNLQVRDCQGPWLYGRVCLVLT